MYAYTILSTICLNKGYCGDRYQNIMSKEKLLKNKWDVKNVKNKPNEIQNFLCVLKARTFSSAF